MFGINGFVVTFDVCYVTPQVSRLARAGERKGCSGLVSIVRLAWLYLKLSAVQLAFCCSLMISIELTQENHDLLSILCLLMKDGEFIPNEFVT
jgi:hypothetical protein